MSRNHGTLARTAMLGACALLLAGCDDLLEVEDPQRFTSSDLDRAPEAVANGAVGDFELSLDNYVIYAGLLSDEYAHTGTWDTYDDYDHGRIRYADAGGNFIMDQLLQVRWFAGAAQERFNRILDNPSTSPLMAKVQGVEALADLYLGTSWCEAPAEAGGAAVARSQILQQAISRLDALEQTAEAAGLTDWSTAAAAGRARANLVLGNYSQAAAEAAKVPTDFSFMAEYSQATDNQQNWIVLLTTAGQNRAAGMRAKWWDMVDADADMLRDPWTNELDPRVPIKRTPGVFGVDGRTPHFSQWKYRTLGADIPIFEGEEMRLIEAEAAWNDGDYQTAVDVVNDLRDRAGLSPVTNPGTREGVREILLHAWFAETMLEGQRLATLHRFGVVGEQLAAGEYGDETVNPRPVLFPLSQDEAVANENIQDAASARCLPMSG